MNWYWHVRIYNKAGRYWHAQITTGRDLKEIDGIQDFYWTLTGCKMLLEGMSEQEYPDISGIRDAFAKLWSVSRPHQADVESKGTGSVTEDQIKHMVNRFLGWRLPENFHPDAGISFKPTFNDHMPHPTKHEPVGTNLFDAMQAEAMVRYMLEGLPHPVPSQHHATTENAGE